MIRLLITVWPNLGRKFYLKMCLFIEENEQRQCMYFLFIRKGHRYKKNSTP